MSRRPKCARPGCDHRAANSPTRPTVYCSAKCRARDYRRRDAKMAIARRVMANAGVFSLVDLVEAALELWRASGDLDDALYALSVHPLLAGSQATAETNGLTSLQNRAGDVLAKASGPAGDDS